MGRSMCPRSQYDDLTYMRGTGPCGPIKTITRSFQPILLFFNTNRGKIMLCTKVYAFSVWTQSCLPETDKRTNRHCSNILEFQPLSNVAKAPKVLDQHLLVLHMFCQNKYTLYEESIMFYVFYKADTWILIKYIHL